MATQQSGLGEGFVVPCRNTDIGEQHELFDEGVRGQRLLRRPGESRPLSSTKVAKRWFHQKDVGRRACLPEIRLSLDSKPGVELHQSGDASSAI